MVLDRTNFRTVDVAILETPFDLVAVDVSFISVRLLAEQLAAVGRAGTDYVVLVKPQFEAGKDQVGSGGIVTDHEVHTSTVLQVAVALQRAGAGAGRLTPSPITGSKGNREFLLHARLGAPGLIDEQAVRRVTT